MPSRSHARLNFLLVLSLLISLIPAPLAAQASPAPRPALERPQATSTARALVWLPLLEPVSYAPVANQLAATTAEAPARVAAQAPAVTHPDPWPPADYTSFVWAGTNGNGAWYWDGTWQKPSIGNMNANAVVNDIAISPYDHDVVLAATEDDIYLRTANQSWLAVDWGSNPPTSTTRWNALHWDTWNWGVVVAAGEDPQTGNGIPLWARSTDNGVTWEWGKLYEGDGYEWEIRVHNAVDVWGANDDWYITAHGGGASNAPERKCYWHSSDGGKTWIAQLVNIDPWPEVTEKWVAGRVQDPQAVYIAHDGYTTRSGSVPAARSYNGGHSWTSVGGIEGDTRHLEYDRTRPNNLWATYQMVGPEGVVRSIDDGLSFASVDDRTGYAIEALTIDGYTGRIYAGGYRELDKKQFIIVYSDDDGSTWSDVYRTVSNKGGIISLSAPQPPYLPDEAVWNKGECPTCSLYGTAVNVYGDPLNTRNGNFTHNQPAFSLPTQGGALSFRLSYIAQATATYTTPLAPGWTHNHAVRLTFPYGEGGLVKLQGHGGSRMVFGNNGDGTFSAAPGLRAALTRLGQSGAYTYVVTATTQDVYTFDNAGLLLTWAGPQGDDCANCAGQTTIYRYDGSQLRSCPKTTSHF